MRRGWRSLERWEDKLAGVCLRRRSRASGSPVERGQAGEQLPAGGAWRGCSGRPGREMRARRGSASARDVAGEGRSLLHPAMGEMSMPNPSPPEISQDRSSLNRTPGLIHLCEHHRPPRPQPLHHMSVRHQNRGAAAAARELSGPAHETLNLSWESSTRVLARSRNCRCRDDEQQLFPVAEPQCLISRRLLGPSQNATSGGSHDQIKYLVTEGCIKPFCDLLLCPDPIIVIVCLECLDNILKGW